VKVVEREIDAPPEVVWELLVDTRRWPEWSPSVRDVRCEGHRLREGARGRVNVGLPGVWLPFHVSALTPGRSWTWRVGGFAEVEHGVEPRGEGGSTLRFVLRGLPRPYAWVCRRAARKLVELAEASSA